MTIASLIVDVAANTAKLQTDVKGIHGQLDGITSVASKMAGVLGVSFSVGAVVNFLQATAEAAGQIVDLSAKTGLSTRAIQEMQFVAGQTGTTLEAFTNAAFKLGTNLAGDDKSVRASVERLGLAWNNLIALKPDQQFEQVVAALHKMENPQERNRLAVELFGKAAKEILPSIAEGYANIAEQAMISGDRQLRAIDAASDAWDGLIAKIKTGAMQALGSVVIAYNTLGTGIDNLTEKEREHLAFLKKSGGDWEAYLDEIAQKHINLRLEQERVKLATDRQAQGFGALKALDIPKDIAIFEQEYKKLERTLSSTTHKQEEMNRAAERFRASVQRLDTAEFWVPFVAGVQEAGRELRELESTIPDIAQSFVPLKQAVTETTLEFVTWGDRVSSIMGGLPNVILQAIQGGGSVLRAAGSFIGTEIGKSFQEDYGKMLKNALPFGLGQAVSAMLPIIGGLLGPLIDKIGGFFKRIFGGPSEDELRGRQFVADFEAQLHSLLTETQRVDAGHESWRMTVIAIRDAYLAQGLSEQEALRDAERLWASSREGGEASRRIIEEIERKMRGSASAAADIGVQLDVAWRDRDMHLSFTVDPLPEVDLPGFASGSNGIRDFGRGTLAVLHGRERVQTEAQMAAERERGGGSNERLERLILDLPRAMKVAMADAMVLQGASK